jgi:hypothetical protein
MERPNRRMDENGAGRYRRRRVHPAEIKLPAGLFSLRFEATYEEVHAVFRANVEPLTRVAQLLLPPAMERAPELVEQAFVDTLLRWRVPRGEIDLLVTRRLIHLVEVEAFRQQFSILRSEAALVESRRRNLQRWRAGRRARRRMRGPRAELPANLLPADQKLLDRLSALDFRVRAAFVLWTVLELEPDEIAMVLARAADEVVDDLARAQRWIDGSW